MIRVRNRRIAIGLLVVWVVWAGPAVWAQLDDRIWFSARVNSQPVRLALDTGAEMPILFRRSAEHLGLEVTWPPADVQATPGHVLAGITEECTLELIGKQIPFRFRVMSLPLYLKPEIDGVLGWSSISHLVTEIHFAQRRLHFHESLSPDVLDVSGWACLQIDSQGRFFVLRVHHHENRTELVLVDTGCPYGIGLSESVWQQWRSKSPDGPITLRASYTPALGVQVAQEAWADRFDLGSITFTHIPVSRGNAVAEAVLGPECIATVGVAALARFEVVIDGPNHRSYLLADPNAPEVVDYSYNRLGVVFVPDGQEGKELLAHVETAGPGYQAGLRDGDVLLAIGDLDTTEWQTDPRVLPLSRFWSQPAGTALQLTIARQGRQHKITAVLKEIFPVRPQ